MIGIYKITSPSGKIYIGKSISINDRLRKYKKNNCKNQIRLYNSLKKYGFENHLFEVIEECDIENLNEKERYWQDYYNSSGEKGLNCSLTSTNDKNGKHSIETKLKISKGNKGKKRNAEHLIVMSNVMKGLFSGENHPMYGKTHSLEARKKISESKIGNNYRLGKTHSEETKEKIRIKNKGRKHSLEAKNKISAAGIGRVVSIETRRKISIKNKGVVFSDERKKKISKSLTGRKIPKETLIKRSISISGGKNYKAKLIIDLETGIYYDCIGEASYAKNIKRSTLNNYLTGSRKNKTSLVYA